MLAPRAQVLVVEDKEDLRIPLLLILEDAGYEVQEAAHVQRALHIIQSSPVPLVVLVDHRMPKLGGPTLLGLVALDHELAAQHAFVFFSAFDHLRFSDLSGVISRLNIDILDKPFAIDALLNCVEKAAQTLPISSAIEVPEIEVTEPPPLEPLNGI